MNALETKSRPTRELPNAARKEGVAQGDSMPGWKCRRTHPGPGIRHPNTNNVSRVYRRADRPRDNGGERGTQSISRNSTCISSCSLSPHFKAIRIRMRMPGSAAASRARVCSEEYISGSFSSYRGLGGICLGSIPPKRSQEASLACLLATVRYHRTGSFAATRGTGRNPPG